MSHDVKLVECKSVFSNGTEYMWFLENYCDNCTRCRNGRCRILNAIEKARWDEKYFPFKDLNDIEGYAGKYCKSFTREPAQRKRPRRKQVPGQIELEVDAGADPADKETVV